MTEKRKRIANCNCIFRNNDARYTLVITLTNDIVFFEIEPV